MNVLYNTPDDTAFNQSDNMIAGQMVQMDPAAEQSINQGIVQGFGQFFFNGLDPNIAKTNVPTKLDSEMHTAIILATTIMIGGVIAGVILLGDPTLINVAVALFVAPYCFYLFISICCSEIRGYITNLKKFDDYKKTYDKMVIGRGYFHFWI
jgi:hypothetical protein